MARHGRERNGVEWKRNWKWKWKWKWNGMEWIGIEWNGAEWNGMEWNGVHGMEQKLVRKQAEAGAENWERHLKVKPALK